MNQHTDGESNLEELARWFLFSVYRHLVAGDWQTPEHSPLPLGRIESLVRDYLQDRSARQSLIMVLKDPRYQFALIRFGPNRDQRLLQLSESTIAYRQARTLLQPLIEEQAGEQAGEQVDTPIEEPVRCAVGEERSRPATASARRAARRAQAALVNNQPHMVESRDSADPGMSDEEYARLERALATPAPAGSEATSRRYANNEDRLSLLSGLLAGMLLFLLVFWLFL